MATISEFWLGYSAGALRLSSAWLIKPVEADDVIDYERLSLDAWERLPRATQERVIADYLGDATRTYTAVRPTKQIAWGAGRTIYPKSYAHEGR